MELDGHAHPAEHSGRESDHADSHHHSVQGPGQAQLRCSDAGIVDPGGSAGVCSVPGIPGGAVPLCSAAASD